MAVDPRAGLAAEIEQLLDGEAAPPAEQLSLLAPPEGSEPHVGGQETEVSNAPPAPRGPGRPPGARNKATRAMASYLNDRYRTPLEQLAKVTHVNPVTFARGMANAELMSFDDAMRWWRDCTVAQLPYRHSKQPVAVDVEGKGQFQLVIGDVADAVADEAAEQGVSIIIDCQAQEMGEPEKEGAPDA